MAPPMRQWAAVPFSPCRAVRRPAILPVPAWPLRLVLPGFAEELLLGGQRVLPKAAAASGFVFEHPEVKAALRAIAAGGGQPDRPCAKPASPHLAGPIRALEG
jgi:hypothetical protein